MVRDFHDRSRELRNIDHHHPESKKRKSSEGKPCSVQPYGRYADACKTNKTMSTIAILWPVKAIFEKRAATVEIETFISPAFGPVSLRSIGGGVPSAMRRVF